MSAANTLTDAQIELVCKNTGLVLKDVKVLKQLIAEGRLLQCLERNPEEIAAMFCLRAEALLEEALEALR